VLVGHSFGGAIVTEYALKNPDRIERLVLIATAGEFNLKAMFRFGLSLPAWLLRLIGPLTRSWLHAPPHALKKLYSRQHVQMEGLGQIRRTLRPDAGHPREP
jgi:pimeloyl-ACP methyl ester carboxylesterase